MVLTQFESLGVLHRMNRQIARVHYEFISEFIPGQAVEVENHRSIQDPALKIQRERQAQRYVDERQAEEKRTAAEPVTV